MSRATIPANIKILEPTGPRWSAIRPTRSQDIFEGATSNFHPDGLFSVETYGRVGSDERDARFSYIDVRTTIFHPYIYYALCQLKALYKGIMANKIYATWDEKEKDFVLGDSITGGETGFAFFVKHWKDIEFKQTGSAIREFRIAVVQKYKDVAMTNKVIVLPAGMRDVEIDEGGRVRQGEVNDYYRTLMQISNSVSTSNAASSVIDPSRNSLQLAFCRVYDYFEMILSGKGGFILRKFASRNIFNGTRNVISSMDTTPEIMGQPNSPKYNNTVMGLMQTMKACLPVAQHFILRGWISKVFNGPEGVAELVNKATLKRETVKLPPDIIDAWTTSVGAEKLINSFGDPGVRTKRIDIADHWIGLVYLGPDMTFRFFNDIDELPPDRSRLCVRPITLVDLLYVSGYRKWNDLAAFVTRYPVTNTGSIYPSFNYVKTTSVGEMRYELGDDWAPIPGTSKFEYAALEYPIVSNDCTWVDSMQPHPSRLPGLQGDFDGDMSSSNVVQSEEAVTEVKRYLKKATSYISSDGGLRASPVTDTIERVMINMTGA